MDIDYDALTAGIPCPHCGRTITIDDTSKTIDASRFGHLGAKSRIVRCPGCRKETQLDSEQ